jgi:UDP-N-acetylmuramoyl-L-alanyl-D-glutamate--2,6-diaminopimelate ligase
MRGAMKLKQIIADVGIADAEDVVDREISGIAYDSRRVTPGMLFVAIRGRNVDGHEYIKTAIKRGAAAVICQSDAPTHSPLGALSVPNTRVALARTAAAFYDHPSSKLEVVGVTGTNGKTTVSFMLKHILETVGRKTGLLGTVRYEIGERMIPAQRTTPEALEIQQMMRQMMRANCVDCVMEVSSHGLEQNRVDQVEFDVAIFTNLTPEHLDYHGGMEPYFAAKRKLFESLRSGPKTGSAVINVDDPYGVRLAEELADLDCLTFGRAESADLRLEEISVSADATRFTFAASGVAHQCELPLIGRYNAMNALAAIGGALKLGVSVFDAVRALRSVATVPGRLEEVNAGQPFSVLVDYAHTEDALSNAMTTLREIADGRLLTLFGCGGNRDAKKRAAMGEVTARMADLAVLTSDNPRNESPESIADQVMVGYASVRDEGCLVELDRARAIEEIIRMAQPGDIVLIAGKGHETYQEFKNTVVPFDDRVHAREALETLGYTD